MIHYKSSSVIHQGLVLRKTELMKLHVSSEGDLEAAEKNACQMEHVISEESFRRLKKVVENIEKNSYIKVIDCSFLW